MLLRNCCSWRLPLRRVPASSYNASSKSLPLVQKEKLDYPQPNPKHHDLQSYREYALRTELDHQSKVYIGTHYEYVVKSSLERLGFSLRQTGGASDYGIDLLGTWIVPGINLSLRVLVQCKATARKSNPSVVRELEGAFVGAPPGWQGHGVMGLLVTQNSASKGIREALGRSRWPMGFVTCTSEGKVLQMLWNRTAEEQCGLAGVGVGLKYAGGNLNDKEIHLTWKGVGVNDQI